MTWLKDNWLVLLGFLLMFASVYMLALKLNQVVRAHNGFVRQTEARLSDLELKAALWEMQENDKLANMR